MDAIWKSRSASGLQSDTSCEHATIQECQDLVNSPPLVEYKYVAEGRANVVFSIWERSGTEMVEGRFKRTLLRVPKATSGVTPCNYESLQAFQENMVEARIGRQHLVPQILISISADVASLLNEAWAKDKSNGSHNNESSVIQPGHAMLVEDMRASPGYKVFEFKPKWLAQSPIAPSDAKRCRTCAREAYRNSNKMTKGLPVSVPICPLGLVHSDRAVVEHTIERLAPEWTKEDHKRLLDAFETTGVLKKIREVQVAGDAGRALLEDPSNMDFGLAMTMRDCSCYIRMPSASNMDVEIKLADTDKKNWEDKEIYWQDTHWNLVDNGWYTCEEEVRPPITTECFLGA
ncbi:inositol-pentakisphosphate 2-kinase-domain-containing protein [Poronia punctata]|nr:inositol-pentakisphosphate 2-kinase-domain-containing protein [Poronia punctata]